MPANSHHEAHKPVTRRQLIDSAFDIITSGSTGSGLTAKDIFSPDFRAYGPCRALFTHVNNKLGPAGSPFSAVEIDASRVTETPGGAAVLVTYRGRHTGTFNGVRPTGRYCVGTGAIIFQMQDDRITAATTVLQWSTTTPAQAEKKQHTRAQEAVRHDIGKVA